ncbi:unnamed protein product [Caenorhabditis nigoni]
MNNTVVVVKPSSGDAFNKLMAFLVENQLDFSVKCSEPIEETPKSSQSSEDIDFPAAKKIREESNFEVPKIPSNESEISDNLADNELRIPKSEPIAQVTNEPAQIVSESNQTDNLADKVPKEEPEPESVESEEPENVQVAPIAHVISKKETTVDPRAVMATGDMDKLECQVCNKIITKTDGFRRKQHALCHLGLRTWKCTVCHRLLTQSCVGRSHFKTTHPEVPYTRLVETISEKDKKQIDEMQARCFPSKPIHRTRITFSNFHQSTKNAPSH